MAVCPPHLYRSSSILAEYAEHITKLNERFIRRRDSKAGDDSFTSLTFDPPRRSRDPSQLVE